MNSAFNFNLLIKATCLGSREWPLYAGLTICNGTVFLPVAHALQDMNFINCSGYLLLYICLIICSVKLELCTLFGFSFVVV